MANSLDIADDDLLYRRLPPDRIRPDGTVTSLAYKLHGKPDTSISVEIARLTSVEECLSRSPQAGVRIGMIAASSARELGFSVRHDPLPANYAHALIEGSNTKDLCRKLARATRLAP